MDLVGMVAYRRERHMDSGVPWEKPHTDLVQAVVRRMGLVRTVEHRRGSDLEEGVDTVVHRMGSSRIVPWEHRMGSHRVVPWVHHTDSHLVELVVHRMDWYLAGRAGHHKDWIPLVELEEHHMDSCSMEVDLVPRTDSALLVVEVEQVAYHKGLVQRLVHHTDRFVLELVAYRRGSEVMLVDHRTRYDSWLVELVVHHMPTNLRQAYHMGLVSQELLRHTDLVYLLLKHTDWVTWPKEKT
jgi:hypothetical protein